MTNRAIIAGSLVDVRNVGTHKSVKLTVHVPAELAQSVFAAFGWPTGVAPVEVAIARLNPEATNRKEAVPSENSSRTSDTTPRPSVVPASATGAEIKERRPFSALPYPQQAALRCNDPIFRAFLRECCLADAGDVRDAEQAKLAIYKLCDIGSRADIKPGTEAEDYWLALEKWFTAWQTADRVGLAPDPLPRSNQPELASIGRGER